MAHADLSAAEPRLLDWLDRGWHGEMEYMARNIGLRSKPASLNTSRAMFTVIASGRIAPGCGFTTTALPVARLANRPG